MKYKSALTSEIKTDKLELCWCNVKLFSWYAYSLFHLVAIPVVFAAIFGRYTPFLLPAIIFISYKELMLMECEDNPINLKIKSINNHKTKFKNNITELEKKVIQPFEAEQLSIFSTSEKLKHSSSEEITVHTLSSRNGYYKDIIEKTDENAEIIDKWLDKATGCLYMTITYRDNEAESMFITKEFFDILYRQFEAQ